MIDCGADWLRRAGAIKPTAIVLTHAHPDHAAGLSEGAPCPVYATGETLDLIKRFPIADRRRITPRKTTIIGDVGFTAFRVKHSLRAPAVGYRVSAAGTSFFYVPDVAALLRPAEALAGVRVYIGDGATTRRSMVRRKGATLIGHAPITAQLAWCKNQAVRRAVFTHCGSEIVGGDARRLKAWIRRLGRDHGIEADIACDGDRLTLSQ
jgi:phosphoribosyl 1,2-cyclic phosphodiesterase